MSPVRRRSQPVAAEARISQVELRFQRSRAARVRVEMRAVGRVVTETRARWRAVTRMSATTAAFIPLKAPRARGERLMMGQRRARRGTKRKEGRKIAVVAR